MRTYVKVLFFCTEVRKKNIENAFSTFLAAWSPDYLHNLTLSLFTLNRLNHLLNRVSFIITVKNSFLLYSLNLKFGRKPELK